MFDNRKWKAKKGKVRQKRKAKKKKNIYWALTWYQEVSKNLTQLPTTLNGGIISPYFTEKETKVQKQEEIYTKSQS